MKNIKHFLKFETVFELLSHKKLFPIYKTKVIIKDFYDIDIK